MRVGGTASAAVPPIETMERTQGPRGRVLCVGCVVLDHIFRVEALPVGGLKTVASDHVEQGGGMAATAAAAIAALGGEVRLWARLGDDTAGSALLAELQGCGICCDGVAVVPGGATAMSVVHIDPAGERMLTNYPGRLPSDPSGRPLDQLSSFGAVLIDPRWPEGGLASAEAARRAGVPSVLDGDAADRSVLAALTEAVDHAVFSEQGLRVLTEEDDPLMALRMVPHRPDQILAVTMGAAGSIWMHDDEMFKVPAEPVEVRDTNGAGDVFHGAYALALAEGRSVLDAARFATWAAVEKCRLGAGWSKMPMRTTV